MTTRELTDEINSRIDDLKTEVNELPCGGSFENLREKFGDIQESIKNFISRLDDIEQGKKVRNDS